MRIKSLPENHPIEVQYQNALSMFQTQEGKIVKEQAELEGLREKLRARAMNPGGIVSTDVFDSTDDIRQAAARLERDIERNQEMLKGRQAELDKCRGARNLLFAELNRPIVVENVKRRARALIEAARVDRDDIDLASAFERLDVKPAFRHMRFAGVGLLEDPQSPIQFHLREIREYFGEIDVDALTK